MLASVAPNVACSRNRDASVSLTIGVGGVPLTVAIRSAEVAGPGLGFSTCRSRLPASVGDTAAVNCVPLLNVVVTADPFTSTCAPLMNFCPVSTTVVEGGPTLSVDGVAELRIGIGFMTEMSCVIDTAGLSTLVMVSCTTLLGVGTTAGAV